MRGIEVIYEDNHLIAVNKKAGMLVHADETGDPTLEDAVKLYIKFRYNKPGDVWLGVLHRLDRPATGVIIFARTSKAAERMSTMFQNRQIKKTYLAITEKRPEELSGRLEHYLEKDEFSNKVKAKATSGGGGKLAISEYEVVGELDSRTLIKVDLQTGKPHQARVQLSKIGCPIVGDLKYGSKLPLPDKSIALHCAQMSFIHPVTKEEITIKAELPNITHWKPFMDME
jgi:23S rRNA pseudouridine1911/1915/1917 synthase